MRAQYDSEQINALANQVDLLEYVTESLEYQRRSGNNYFFSCPLHSDSDPSLAIDVSDNHYHCYACGKHGYNVLSWMMDYEGLSYPAACEKVQRITGTTVQPSTTSESIRFYKRMEKIKNGFAGDNLGSREYQEYSDYLKYSGELPTLWLEEGISEDAMRCFNVRTDPVKNRILYPIYDSDGRYICPKARTTLKAHKALGIPKYKYLGYIGTNDFLVGWKENRDEITSSHSIILFEGIKSVMKAWDWGYKNTAACETATINDEQVKLLVKNRIGDVTIAFDSDKKMRDLEPRLKTLKQYTNLYMINDTNRLLGEKESPVDRGREVFEQLLNERVRV